MLIKSGKGIPASEITDQQTFLQRRQIIKGLLVAGLSGSGLSSQAETARQPDPVKLSKSSALQVTPSDIVKNYTNYYEFGFAKEDAAHLAHKLNIAPWTVEISGEVQTPLKLNLEDIFATQTIQEYVYRFRCVEGWSMVVPWLGFPLHQLLKRAQPLSSAKFVKFTSVSQPEAMPLLAGKTMLSWPYVEGLRIDEASHPLTLLAVGMYGHPLPKQNGAPLRLVTPWKYGFKSIKAIVKIELLKRAPLTSWNQYAPHEYGFYANVNPEVPHPRWSQISERQLGSRFFSKRRETELFNGYAEQVAGLYSDMDLRHFF
jgi:methionine sulfoxide reductase catalytic subunit